MAASIQERIIELKKKRAAVILAHNYQRGDVQDIADYVGDSLGLSQQAAKTDAEMILFCGVDFMAETAAILCPDKKVCVPDEHAGCPMANMVTPRELGKKKAQHPGAAVVCYVNSSAAIKAMSDICCTSSNAVKVVQSIDQQKEILFIPDMSLGHYVSTQLGRDLILWPGYCPTHHRILAEHIEKRREEFPEAKVLVHPECTEDVIRLADHVASTGGILKYCRQSDATEFVIGTEIGILHRLKKENPQKRFIAATPLSDCPNMKLNTLEKVLWELETPSHEMKVPKDVADKARRTIERMLEIS